MQIVLRVVSKPVVLIMDETTIAPKDTVVREFIPAKSIRS